MQGKLFQRCTHFLYWSVLYLGGKVNTRRMLQPDMESIFTKIIYEIFWSYETIMGIFKIIKIKCFYPPRILDEHWSIYSCLQIHPERTGFNVCAEYTRPQLTFLALVPCLYRFHYSSPRLILLHKKVESTTYINISPLLSKLERISSKLKKFNKKHLK